MKKTVKKDRKGDWFVLPNGSVHKVIWIRGGRAKLTDWRGMVPLPIEEHSNLKKSNILTSISRAMGLEEID